MGPEFQGHQNLSDLYYKLAKLVKTSPALLSVFFMT